MKGAAILVHYRTPELVPLALQALQSDAATTGLDMEWILVDNGSEPRDRDLWRELDLRILDPGRNLGYAGGVNHGVEHTDADWWVVLNPDVFVRPGCLQALLSALQDGADIAGPRFFWDQEGLWHLPPTEKRRRLDEYWTLLARLGEAWARHARARWRRHAHVHWTASANVESFELSGALLAIRRPAWKAIGAFDEGYRLYFEETDWLERLRRVGGKAVFVPRAEAIHLHARSTVAENRSEGWFVDSARRFRRRHYGRLFNALLERAGAWMRVPGSMPPGDPAERWRADGLARAAWLEASASSSGFPAAGVKVSGPDEAWIEQQVGELRERLSGAGFTLRLVDDRGRELQARAF